MSAAAESKALDAPVSVELFQVKPAEGAGMPDFAVGSREAAALGPQEVLVRVLACGVCHTDFFMFKRAGATPGHEIVGVVEAVGSGVTDIAVGTRVGAGYQASSCGHCEECGAGFEPLCGDMKSYFSVPNGGFASHVTWDSRFVFPIPDALPSPVAAPLLCAGATVYSALLDAGAEAGKTVGVIGIGGLGHVAVQMAAAMGCEVVALTRTADKEAQAKAMGASRVVVTTDAEAMKAAAKSMHVLLSTVPGDLDWAAYLKLVKPRGTATIVGIPSKPLAIPGGSLIMGGLSVQGSLIAGRQRMVDMLALCADKGIRPYIEVSPMTPEGIKKAITSVDENTVRFRAVLVREGCDGVDASSL